MSKNNDYESVITNVEFYEHDSDSNSNRRRNKSDKEFIGFASITINDDLVINGFRVFDTDEGGWVGNPGGFIDKRSKDWKDTVYGLSEELRESIQEEILDAAGLDYNPREKEDRQSSKRNSRSSRSSRKDKDEDEDRGSRSSRNSRSSRREEEEDRGSRKTTRKRKRSYNYED